MLQVFRLRAHWLASVTEIPTHCEVQVEVPNSLTETQLIRALSCSIKRQNPFDSEEEIPLTIFKIQNP